MNLELKHIIACQSIHLISKTWRIENNIVPERNSIIAFWHGKMLGVWRYFSSYSSTAVVSMSKDGEILSRLLSKWNYELIRGSSSKGSKDVLEAMLMDQSDYLLITPDGPRGPYQRFKAGAVVVAQRTGKPLYLCGCRVNIKKVFSKSWDRFELPLFFTSIKLSFSDKILISKDLDREQINKMIRECEIRLNELNNC